MWVEVLQRLRKEGTPCALATVVEACGSTSAKAGDKAIFDHEGYNLHGWVGGSCAEAQAAEAASASLKDGKTRVVEVDLDDVVLGVPCGGKMKLYVEPYTQTPRLVLIGQGRIVVCLAQFGTTLGFELTVDAPHVRGEDFPNGCRLITQDPAFERLSLDEDAYVVVAAHQATDYLAVKKALKEGAAYVALVASVKRGDLVREQLHKHGVSTVQTKRLRTPAGLDLGAVTPEEIALSVMAEIVACRRGRSSHSTRAA